MYIYCYAYRRGDSPPMTISYFDRFAAFPKRCDKCNRLFWLEWYNQYEKLYLGVSNLKWIKCKKCVKGENKDDKK